jgi:hypothetical protein
VAWFSRHATERKTGKTRRRQRRDRNNKLIPFAFICDSEHEDEHQRVPTA